MLAIFVIQLFYLVIKRFGGFMSIAASLAAQSAIMRANQAEMAAIRASQAQQSLIGSGGDFNSIARKESHLEAEKIKAETRAKVSRAQAKALKEKSKRNKLDVMA